MYIRNIVNRWDFVRIILDFILPVKMNADDIIVGEYISMLVILNSASFKKANLFFFYA